MPNVTRRLFIRTSAVGMGAAMLASAAPASLRSAIAQDQKPSKKLITRKLGKTGIDLPIVSMGVMRADNPGLVKAALETGMVHLDTAHGYQKGKNEEMLGEVLKAYPRDSFVIGTKITPEDREKKVSDADAGTIKAAFLAKLDLSLQRLQMKYVDILYLHGAASRDAVLSAPYIEALKEAKASGKAKHIGVSTHKNEPEVIQAAIDSGVYEVVLTSLNFKQDHYQEMKKAIASAAKAGIGIVAMKTMAGGYLDKERKKPVNCKAALKFVLQDENVTTSIPGITTFEHLAENAAVNEELTMTGDEKESLSLGKLEGGLYCQGCEQCSANCKKGLPIPEIMRAYMYAYGYANAAMGHELLAELDLGSNPCGDCGRCTAVCSKGFAVSEKIADISRLVDVPYEFIG
ncbi:MAG: aldo/keto reductase [Ignavibacteriales bacterium]|nr:aldo/keto reductase [Ignavibacteriales bacterium]